MKKLLPLLLALAGICQTVTAQISSTIYSPHERLSLDNGWHFHLGDIAFPIITGHNMTYNSAKAGKAWGAADPEYDDTKWRTLNLPHDWAVESPFDSTENCDQGYRKRGVSWYRRNFKLAADDRGKYIELQFDGISTHCTIWVNGTLMLHNYCGYTSSYVDVTSLMKYGDELNSVAVRVDADPQEGWWYEGAGIYRHTWLVKQSPVHIMTDGVFANPIKKAGEWIVPVEVTIENVSKNDAKYKIESTVLDDNGTVVASAKSKGGKVESLDKSITKFNISVANPKLWSLENPTMYKVRTVLIQDGKPADTLNTTCGFRTIQFRADSGFYLNDKWLKIKGTANHQDHAGVGVALPDAIWDFRVKKLKEMGVNTNRCAHNPPSSEFLDACDRNGLMIMDENRNFNISPEYKHQLEWMVCRDRNHPSVILWSVFNEEPMQATENGYEMVRRMCKVVKKLDTTRPVTAAQNGGFFTPINVSYAVDVVGINYHQDDYENFHKMYPNKPMTSSEDVSGEMNRGEYVTDEKKHYLAAYDEVKPKWGNTHRTSWKNIEEKPYVAGCFVWTGFDYRGETQPFEWPSTSSVFGCMDVCGFPKTAFYIHQAQWLPETQPVLQLVPHWNWSRDSIGKKIKVMAVSNAEIIKLKLNGREVGEQKVDKYQMNIFLVPYKPGKLEAFGYKGGKEVSHFIVETTGEPASMELIPYRNSLAGDGVDATPITVRVLDAKGRPIENAKIPFELEINGPASIIGIGNGDNNTHNPEKGTKGVLFNGLAQVIVQSKAASVGDVVLTVRSSNLKAASITVKINKSAQIPSVEVPNLVLVLEKWKVSPFYDNKPDPNIEVAAYDQNTWVNIITGSLQEFAKRKYALYRTSFKPYTDQCEKGGKIVFKSVAGKADVWLDNRLIYTKTNFEKGDFKVPFEPGQNKRSITLLVEANNGKGGLEGEITVE